MPVELVIVLLLAIASVVAIVAEWLDVPYTVALVITGLALGSTHLLPSPHLTKDLLFTLLLPGLLFEAAFHIEARDFWRNKLAIVSLALPGVVAATLITGGIVALIARSLGLGPGLDLAASLVFGALIAATDPVAVVAIFRALGMPSRLLLLIEGESLLNDGTAVVFFTLILSYVRGQSTSLATAAMDLAYVVGVGVVIGFVVGLVTTSVARRIEKPMVEITLTVIAAYGSFACAELLHASGVIATVAAGMLSGNYKSHAKPSPRTRIAVESFWEYIAFLMNSIIFLLIGLEVDLEALLPAAQAIGAAFVAVIAARALVIVSASALLRRSRESFPWAWSVVLAWGGLRGALSMVLALSLPLDFAPRDSIVRVTFGVVLLSILIQGLSMKPLIKRLGLSGADTSGAQGNARSNG